MSGPPAQLGPYVIGSVLGEGHFGTVYMARGRVPEGTSGRSERDRRVAIKQLRCAGVGTGDSLARRPVLSADFLGCFMRKKPHLPYFFLHQQRDLLELRSVLLR